MYIECDEYGSYKLCVICGYMKDVVTCNTKPTTELSLQKYYEISPLPLDSGESVHPSAVNTE